MGESDGVAGRTPIQTVHADFPHTASQWSLRSPHYANPGHRARRHAIQGEVSPPDAVHRGVEATVRGPLGRDPQSTLQLARFDSGLPPTGGVGTGLAGHALTRPCAADMSADFDPTVSLGSRIGVDPHA